MTKSVVLSNNFIRFDVELLIFFCRVVQIFYD